MIVLVVFFFATDFTESQKLQETNYNQSGSARFPSNQRLNHVQHGKQLLNNLLRSVGSA